MQLARFILPALLAVSVADAQYTQPVDERSYNLGIIGGFSEVVYRGVKTLALSEVMDPATMDDIWPDAEIVAERNNVMLYRETDLIVTDLFPADVAAGKHVLLKADKEMLVANNEYSGEKRREIAMRFGRLLSYPDSVLEEMLAGR